MGERYFMKKARIYMRVSTDQQDLTRQEALIDEAQKNGFYIAGIYREKASGASIERPELTRLLRDLQKNDIIIAEKIDRLSRLPLEQAQKLISSIKEKGGKLAIPGIVDLSQFIDLNDSMGKIIIEAIQDMLLKIALQMSYDDYETRRKRIRSGIELARKQGKYKGRPPNKSMHQRILILKSAGNSISKTAQLAGCSVSQVKRVCALHNNNICSKNNSEIIKLQNYDLFE